MSKINTQDRTIYMDLARIFAIISIVFCHAIETAYPMHLGYWYEANIFNKIYRTIGFTFGRLGVPIFLYLSGSLLLSKIIKNDDDVFKFYKHNLFPLFIAVELWNTIYNIFDMIINNVAFNFKEFVLNILFLKNSNMMHMWYMPMIIGIYITVPFLCIIVKHVSIKALSLPLAIAFLIYFITPNFNIFTQIYGFEQYWFILNSSFLGGIYGIYILLGYYMNFQEWKKLKAWHLLLIAIVLFFITCGFQIWTYMHNFGYTVWYDFSVLILCTLFLYMFFKRINLRNKFFIRIVIYISKISLGIYFLHRPIQILFIKYYEWIFLDICKLFASLVIFFVSFVLSIIMVFLLCKINILKKYLFIIK